MAQTRSPEMSDWRLPQRVAYVVNHSFPYSSDGYAVRTHEVAKALTGLGHDVLVINRPGRPWDIEGFAATTQVAPEQRIDGVRYLFLPSPATPQMNLRARIRAAETRLLEAFEVFRPAAVVAVSNWENAEPAQYAARRAGVPFFYEQRGFWEMSRAASDPVYAASDACRQAREKELRIACDAQAVFTLNGAMRAELIRRGVPGEKIHLVPNGVSPPGPVAKGVTRAGLGIAARYLIGYIGSLSAYEGCDDLLALLSRLRADGVDVDLLVVGSSAPKGLVGAAAGADPQEARLRAQAEALGLQAHAHFVPQVPQQETGAYYGMLDAVIMPRRRVPVTELVSPLKPYAAAAYRVPVFMTDMPPLDEVAADIHGTLFPEGDIDALAGMVRRTLREGTHPVLQKDLPPRVFWPQRMLPMSRLLNAVRAATPSLQGRFGQGADPVPDLPGAGFDLSVLPQVALRDQLPPLADETIAALGPCRHLPDTARVVRLNRANILGQLATLMPGRFIIDWTGLQPPAGETGDRVDEWHGLWSLENMRLNRQIMDACRIALQRGWKVQVLGPVLRSKAPLFRTVAGVVEEITLPGNAAAQEVAQ